MIRCNSGCRTTASATSFNGRWTCNDPDTGFDLAKLAHESAFINCPPLLGYNATRAELEASADALFEVVRSGAVRIEIHQTYPLVDAAQAHRDLEGRKTTGLTILIP